MDSSLAFAIQSIMILLVSWSVVIVQGNLGELAQVERKTWFFLIAAGVLTCTSSLLSFYALKMGNAAQVSPITNTSLVFAVILASLFLKEKINWQIILGTVLMGTGAVLIAIAKK